MHGPPAALASRGVGGGSSTVNATSWRVTPIVGLEWGAAEVVILIHSYCTVLLGGSTTQGKHKGVSLAPEQCEAR